MRVFVSHSSKDAKVASGVCSLIEASGHKCFLAPRDIRSGYEYAEEIVNGIDSSDVILLLLSAEANDSPHVLREIERAVSKKKSIIVYKLEEVSLSKSMEYFLMTHQWLNAKSDNDYSEIVRCINEFAEINAENPPKLAGEPLAEQKSDHRVKKRTLIIVLAAVLLAAAGTVASIVMINKKQNSGNIPEFSDTSESNSSQYGEAVTSPVTESNEIRSEQFQTNEAEVSSAPSETQDSNAITPVYLPEGTDEQTEPNSSTTSNPSSTEPVNTTASNPAQTQSVPSTTSVQDSETAVSAAQVELGDTIVLGTYNDEPIEWRVINISSDKTKAVVIANSILTMKAYDAAESGKFNTYDGKDYWNVAPDGLDAEIQRKIRGDNRWELSNIRTWLNSDKENVTYKDQEPTSRSMAEQRNGYNTEAGFLNGFTKEELSMIVTTNVKTGETFTEDKVFLLSTDELQWLYDADVSIYAKPTQAAIEQDTSYWYSVNVSAYDIKDHYWWLRDANGSNSCEAYYINISYSDERIASGSVGLEGYGIRPAMTLDLTSAGIISKLEKSNGIS